MSCCQISVPRELVARLAAEGQHGERQFHVAAPSVDDSRREGSAAIDQVQDQFTKQLPQGRDVMGGMEPQVVPRQCQTLTRGKGREVIDRGRARAAAVAIGLRAQDKWKSVRAPSCARQLQIERGSGRKQRSVDLAAVEVRPSAIQAQRLP